MTDGLKSTKDQSSLTVYLKLFPPVQITIGMTESEEPEIGAVARFIKHAPLQYGVIGRRRYSLVIPRAHRNHHQRSNGMVHINTCPVHLIEKENQMKGTHT